MTNPLVVQLEAAFLLMLIGLVPTVGALLLAMIQRRTHSIRLQEIEASVVRSAEIAVVSIGQTQVAAMKADPTSSPPGELSDEQAAQVKDAATRTTLKMVGPSDVALLEKAKGKEAVAALVDNSIEAAVSNTRPIPNVIAVGVAAK